MLLPYAMRTVVDKEIDVMLKMKIIEPSSSPYASPMVIVKKPESQISKWSFDEMGFDFAVIYFHHSCDKRQ